MLRNRKIVCWRNLLLIAVVELFGNKQNGTEWDVLGNLSQREVPFGSRAVKCHGFDVIRRCWLVYQFRPPGLGLHVGV